jgi:hypothetical protein
MHMRDRKYSYTELGMLLGLFAGGGLAIIMFATTGEVTYFATVGIGLALGLGLGAAFDAKRSSAQESSNGLYEEER